MRISVHKGDLLDVRADVLVVNLFQGVTAPGGVTGAADAALGGALGKEIRDLSFEGKLGETLVLATLGTLPAARVALAGLGSRETFSAETVRRVAASVVRRFRGGGVGRIATVLHGAGIGGLGPGEAAQALAEGALLADYHFKKHRTPQKGLKRGIEELVIVEREAAKARQAEAGVARALLASAAAVVARDLVNEPASICTPAHLADHAQALAKGSGRITAKVFDRAEAERRGMGAFLAVARGAGEEPRFIHLTYRPKGKSKRRIALVGKGITFDSGGLQIKPDHGMASMKTDMAGAAAVLGVFSALPTLSPDVEVHGIIAATENMPGPMAYKPGDVVRAMDGTTIEIGHTDAEGRVTLADSLSYAAALKPDLIVDLATLTGAAMSALGEEIAALMANDAKLGDRLKKAAAESGERLWELPLAPEYRDLVKGTAGDLSNSGSVRYGGAITAGLFLEHFVKGTPWAHLDIAGPAWAEREFAPYLQKGGTGYGVRTLLRFLQSF